jgi:HK97 family phage prohead protease
MSRERRIHSGSFEIRAAPAPDGATMLVGYPIVWNTRSVNLGGFVEEIDPSALDALLAADPDVRCLFNHDDNLILGRTRSATLKLTKDPRGLYMECALAATQIAKDVSVSIERKDVTGGSFTFNVAPGGALWTEDPETGVLVRRVLVISRLWDVGPVTFPAYTDTEIEARSELDQARGEVQVFRRMKAEARERELRLAQV